MLYMCRQLHTCCYCAQTTVTYLCVQLYTFQLKCANFKERIYGIWQLAITPGNCQMLSVEFSNFPFRRPSAALMAKCLAPKVVCVTKIYGYVPQFSATSSCRLFDWSRDFCENEDRGQFRKWMCFIFVWKNYLKQTSAPWKPRWRFYY